MEVTAIIASSEPLIETANEPQTLTFIEDDNKETVITPTTNNKELERAKVRERIRMEIEQARIDLQIDEEIKKVEEKALLNKLLLSNTDVNRGKQSFSKSSCGSVTNDQRKYSNTQKEKP